ncbi:TRAP transporter large permease [Marinobacterium stanieri]|uniref:TRAP transporter large permease protein n=1 Tax=Marinobacterium stanieri TaxID=49186 RepID=A0A1N6NMC9_9GAMM|nr:TRAP transporter large permease [Marinobacterium stanieri]SIP93116.1 TRAP transporter, DctM subunit [Marinobacterium stanieri]
MTAALIGFATVLGLAFFGVPLGFSMLLVGFVGFAALRGLEPTLAILPQLLVDSSFTFGLSVLPLFILMGVFIHRAGVSEELYDTAQTWLGSYRGGLAQATVAACAMFGMISGSSLAASATMSKVAIPQMQQRGYSLGLASGCVAAAGVLGMLIPPSVPLMIYGLIADQDIRQLFIAVTVPGVLVALSFVVAVILYSIFRPTDLPSGGEPCSLKEKLSSLKGVIWTLILFLVVIGGMYGGAFTVTEAAGVGCMGAFVIALMRGTLGVQGMISCAMEAGKTTGMLFLIIFGAMMFTNFINLSGFSWALGEWVRELGIGRIGILLAIAVIYILLGCVLETLGLMLLTVPIFLPIVMEYGVSGIWFGVFLIMMVELGQLTPPVGLNVLTVKAVVPQIPTSKIFIGVLPFLFCNLVIVALIIMFPEIVLAPLSWF